MRSNLHYLSKSLAKDFLTVAQRIEQIKKKGLKNVSSEKKKMTHYSARPEENNEL